MINANDNLVIIRVFFLGGLSLFPFNYFCQASDLQLVVYAFTSFGKKQTKKKQLHPDAFIQLALQLGYYRLHGR